MKNKIFFPAAALLISLMLVKCKNQDSAATADNAQVNQEKSQQPVNIPFTIGQITYPHDTSSFTQGLAFYKGGLYEGTGNYGKSKLMKVDLKTGKPLLSALPLDKKYFGEGITILNDTLYQLTWQENVVFVYTVKDLKKVKEFPISTQGWGITNDGKNLIVSSGGNNIDYYEPSNFRKIKSISVTEAGADSYNLNELEFINGYIYANQWNAPYIFKINPADGKIVGKMNLVKEEDAVKARYPGIDVLNGIAYDDVTKKTYITGKNWPVLFEIQFAY